MSKMKQSEWMRGLLECEHKISSIGFVEAEQHLYRMTEDFIRFNRDFNKHTKYYGDYYQGYKDCIDHYKILEENL